MKKISCAVLVICAFMSIQALGQVAMVTTEPVAMAHVAADSLSDPNTSFGSPLACSQPQKLQIPQSVAKRAKLKAQLMNVLRESIFDDAKGIVNLARERQIKDLVHKLAKENPE